MKIIRIENNIVAEILHDSIKKIEDVAHWFNADFASQCIEAPDDVCQGEIYDTETKIFSKPVLPVPTPEELRKTEVDFLKEQIAQTDYKVIKCSECSLAGIELPYDIVVLNAERQAIRDKINELEG